MLFGAIPDVTLREKIDFFTILGDLHEVCLKASTMCNSHRFNTRECFLSNIF